MPKSTKTQQPKDEKRYTICLFQRKYFLKYAFRPKILCCFNDTKQNYKGFKERNQVLVQEIMVRLTNSAFRTSLAVIQCNNKINNCPLKLNLKKIEKQKSTKIKKKKKIPFGRLGKALVTLL
jgi:hypothetical protein